MAEKVAFFPIRHHSPACAIALRRALDALEPTRILIEAPSDFAALIPQLTDPEVRLPLAAVSLPEGPDEPVSTWPFCDHSPEYVAMAWARQRGVEVVLIDLPSSHPAMWRRGEGAPAASPLLEDHRLDHNAYVTELARRRGVSDPCALWDALFESQATSPDWAAFFQTVETHCANIRAVSDLTQMPDDLAREAEMARHLFAATAQDGLVAVVTGGFHTPALRQALLDGPAKAPAAKRAAARSSWLVRYGFRQLDAARGYAAGAPHPAWQDRLWREVSRDDGDPAGLVERMLIEFADHLRRTKPQLALPTPSVAAAIQSARRLAELRDLPWPGRSEMIDAVRSVDIKEATENGRTPLLDELDVFLSGDRVGELPVGAAQPPIVEQVRRRARELGFNLESAEPRNRTLDLRRKARHAKASGFLFCLTLLEVDFARRISGPDPVSGWREDMMFETWRYAWSPQFESRLIALAGDGPTLDALCIAALDRRLGQLEREGRLRSAGAVAPLVLAAVRTGEAIVIDRALVACREAMAEDAEIVSIIRALSVIDGALALAFGEAPDLSSLNDAAFARLVLLFPDLASRSEDGIADLIKALADLAGLLSGQPERSEVLAEVVTQVLEGALPPALDGAMIAFAAHVGAITSRHAADRIALAMDGAYVAAGARVAVLSGCLAVAPRLLLTNPRIAESLDRLLTDLEGPDFVQMLPELRYAMSQLSPTEIDRIAAWVADLHGLSLQHLRTNDVSTLEALENLDLTASLERRWRAEGLDDWIGGAA